MLQEFCKHTLSDCACHMCLQVSVSTDVHTEAVCSPDFASQGGPSLCLAEELEAGVVCLKLSTTSVAGVEQSTQVPS